MNAMRVEAETDVRALRRLTLLVRRAKEDGLPCSNELGKIASILDRMRRSVALGTPSVGDDLRAVASLVGELSCERRSENRVHEAVITELRDLTDQLTP